MTALLTIAGWLDLATTIVLAGGLLYAALIAMPAVRGRRAARQAAAVLGAVLLAEFGLTAYRMSVVSGMRGLPVLLHLLETRWGRLWILRVAGLVALAAPEGLAPLGPRALAGVAGVWLATRSFQGHAGAHGTVPALIDWLHLLAATVWLGGLAQLAAVPDPLPILLAERFRGVAAATLAVLVPAGVYGAFLHVPSTHALTTSPYGRTLIAKLVGATLLFGLGATNHFRHVPALARGEQGAAGALKRTIVAEIALATGILLLTALLGVLPMPHELPVRTP